MDLRKYSITVEQAEKSKALFDYQPFIISDRLQTGTAYQWLYPERCVDPASDYKPVDQLVADKNVMPMADWKDFCSAAQSQRNMYEDWIDGICRFLPDLSGMTMVDVACNNGYFPVSFSLRGVKEAHGYDMTDHSGSFDMLNALTGSRATFHHASYNSMTHTIEQVEAHDIVIASAIMEHISDPLYFMNFVSGICKKLLFLFLPVVDTKELRISFNDTKSVHVADAKFPVCFESVKLSTPLVYRSLELCGFKKVVEIYRRESWIPLSFYRNRRVFIALR